MKPAPSPPLAALDANARAEILPCLDRLHRELAIPILYARHAADEVARLADHLVCLHAGRVTWQGTSAAGLAQIGVFPEHATRVIAHENGSTLLDVAGQTLRVQGLDAQPGDVLRMRLDKEI